MKRSVVSGVLVGVALSLGACSTPQFQTLKIFDSPNRVVALQAMSDAYGGKGYDHPISLTTEEMTRLLKGIRVKRGVMGGTYHPALSDTEIQVFVPHLVNALQKSTKEELVTFFETAHLDDVFDLTTSGGLFVAGGNFYVVLSNFSVKTRAWQDAEQHEASYRGRPLEQINPQPGRLVFEPQEYMVESPDGEIGSRFQGKPWQVAIRYKEFLGTVK
ncbi:MAG: hypothetical protein OEZ05_05075 [Nitrospirota bacterium]|nr:hypothetical protein [Nitrospirota bacterium]MDH5585981.1 hypothetical protein [Nitrospirota bacterium]